LASPGSKKATPGLLFIRILRPGTEGDDVRQLQQRLVALGYSDLVVDGRYSEVTEKAVKAFQLSRNLDPDGEVGDLTLDELNAENAMVTKPPLLPPSTEKYGKAPPWYDEAVKWIGFHEKGNNQGIEKFIAGAHTGSLGDPWCAIFANYCLEANGVKGSKSPAARSFTHSLDFVETQRTGARCDYSYVARLSHWARLVMSSFMTVRIPRACAGSVQTNRIWSNAQCMSVAAF
jgi:peptidoglycan hydrolase-like protein with peptidoglycan-binding domain